MLSLRRPLDIAAIVLAAALAALGIAQLVRTAAFDQDAVQATARIVALETAQRGLLDSFAETFAEVEYTPAGEGAAPVRTSLPESLSKLGIPPEGALGREVEILYDPSRPAAVRAYAADQRGGAYVLFALALGALFAPFALRRLSLVASLTPGGG